MPELSDRVDARGAVARLAEFAPEVHPVPPSVDRRREYAYRALTFVAGSAAVGVFTYFSNMEPHAHDPVNGVGVITGLYLQVSALIGRDQ